MPWRVSIPCSGISFHNSVKQYSVFFFSVSLNQIPRFIVFFYSLQVRVITRKICEPLEEDSFRPILHHYDGPKFRLELNIPEVNFHPTNLWC